MKSLLCFRTYVTRADDSPQNWCSSDPLNSSVYGVRAFGSTGATALLSRSLNPASSCGRVPAL